MSQLQSSWVSNVRILQGGAGSLTWCSRLKGWFHSIRSSSVTSTWRGCWSLLTLKWINILQMTCFHVSSTCKRFWTPCATQKLCSKDLTGLSWLQSKFRRFGVVTKLTARSLSWNIWWRWPHLYNASIVCTSLKSRQNWRSKNLSLNLSKCGMKCRKSLSSAGPWSSSNAVLKSILTHTRFQSWDAWVWKSISRGKTTRSLVFSDWKTQTSMWFMSRHLCWHLKSQSTTWRS